MKNWKVDEEQEADEKLIFCKLQPLASYKRVSLKNTCSGLEFTSPFKRIMALKIFKDCWIMVTFFL